MERRPKKSPKKKINKFSARKVERENRKKLDGEKNNLIGDNQKKRLKILFIFIILCIIAYIYLFAPIYVCPNVDKTSEWYVNDMYMSNQYYYKNLLTDHEREIYKIVFEKLKTNEKYIYVNCTTDELSRVMDSIICDHPELINLGKYSFSEYASTITLTPEYAITSPISYYLKERTMRRHIGKVVKAVEGKSDYEKEKYVYKWLGMRGSYGDAIVGSDQNAYSAFSFITNTVCAGYGKAAQILLENVGVNSIININNDHLWNTVKLDGEYYFFDSTVTSNTRENIDGNVSYMGLNQNGFTSNYEIKYPSVIPAVTGKKYNYYDFEGLTFTYTPEIVPKIKEILNSTEFNKVELKFTNPDEAEEKLKTEHLNELQIKEIYRFSDYSENNGVLMLVKRDVQQ